MKGYSILALLLMSTSIAVADATDEVRCREIAFSLSAEVQDLDLFQSFLDPDARFAGNSVQRGPAEVAEAWKVFFEPGGPAIRWRPKFVEVLEDGRLALTRGPWLIVTRDEKGEQTEQWGTFNSVWRLHDDGEWRVVFDAGSPAAGPIPASVRTLLAAEPYCDAQWLSD
jgi:ketosteroid isomerase-like protein